MRQDQTKELSTKFEALFYISIFATALVRNVHGFSLLGCVAIGIAHKPQSPVFSRFLSGHPGQFGQTLVVSF